MRWYSWRVVLVYTVLLLVEETEEPCQYCSLNIHGTSIYINEQYGFYAEINIWLAFKDFLWFWFDHLFEDHKLHFWLIWKGNSTVMYLSQLCSSNSLHDMWIQQRNTEEDLLLFMNFLLVLAHSIEDVQI